MSFKIDCIAGHHRDCSGGRCECECHDELDARSDERTTAPATIDTVPNQPKTPVSTFRIPLDLKAKVKEKTQERGDDMTEIVIKAFQDYLKKK